MESDASQAVGPSTSAHHSTQDSNESDIRFTPVAVATRGSRWGLFILLGAFVTYFIADGWSYSFGVFYPHLVEEFKQGKGKTAVIGALLYGLPLLLSPVVCALTDLYGCRTVVICGGVLLGAYFIASSMATSIVYMYVVTGMFGSVGMAMTYIPTLVIVTYYFDKRRGLATGLSVVGSGLGASTFPMCVEYLMQVYGWRGMLLLLGAVAFHIVPAGMLYRPQQTTERVEKRPSEEALLSNAVPSYQTEGRTSASSENAITRTLSHSTSALYSPRLASTSQRDCVASHGSLGEDDFRANSSLLTNQHMSSCPELYTEVRHTDDKTSSSPSEHAPVRTNCLTTFSSKLFKSMFDKSLAFNKPYLLFCASSFVLYLWIGIPFVYLVDKAIIMKIPNDSAVFLLSIVAIARTIGQVVMGYLGDHSKLNTVLLYAVVTSTAGLGTVLLPLCYTYSMLCVYACVFGLGMSVTYCLQMLILVQLVGLHRVTSAFGLLQLVQGIATLLGTPTAGQALGFVVHSFVCQVVFVFPKFVCEGFFS